MSNKIVDKMTLWQGNAWPAMLEDLGTHLGVSANALELLGIGWAPVVEFKKGPNYQGWWAIPERDANGGVVGVSLRNQGDFKCMYPGSKHGLTYPVNPEHKQGASGYQAGAHNWARTMDAGVDCPICEKPDGCLVSAEDPEDPKAVICIRQQAGAERPMKFGYLHVRHEKGKVNGAPVLPPADDWVVVVEGMTDTAAAIDLGFVAVGRPSNLAGLDVLKDVVRGRKVIVVGENDDVNPATGKRPGHEGMVAAFQMLKGAARDLRMVLPPEHFKDLRSWVRQSEMTHDSFLEYSEQQGREEDEQKVLPDSKPLTIARAYLDSRHRMAGRYTLRYFKGAWYEYTGEKYAEVDENIDIRGPLYGWADDKMAISATDKGENVRPIEATKGWVNNIIDAMLFPCAIKSDDAPCWINDMTGPPPGDLIGFNNGLLQISKYVAGADFDEYMLPRTPDLFSTFSLPFSFDPDARCPRWRRFLEETLGDRDKIKLAREWFGYNISADTSYQKMMIIRGPRASGKSTFARMMEKVIGKGQVASPKFADFMQNFGLHKLIGKHVALMGDARLPTRGDAMQALETMLKITGEDSFDVPRKFKDDLTNYKFSTRFTLTTNELPALPDHSGAMRRRLLILDFPNSFEGREDWDLDWKLDKETNGVIVWALEGLRRLNVQQRFTRPEAMLESMQEWKTSTSPLAAFIEEACDEGVDFEVDKHELYDAWNAWSQERGIRTINKSRFLERLKANSQHAHTATYEKNGHKHSVCRGLKLKPWAERRLLGRPN